MVCFNSFKFQKFFLYVSSAKPDQTPRSVASDLVLHCLPSSHKTDAKLITAQADLSLFL